MLTSIRKIVNNPSFNHFITIVILIQAAVLVLETIPTFNAYYSILESISMGVLIVYIIEAGLKISGSYPNFSNYFKNGWNILDFSIIIL